MVPAGVSEVRSQVVGQGRRCRQEPEPAHVPHAQREQRPVTSRGGLRDGQRSVGGGDELPRPRLPQPPQSGADQGTRALETARRVLGRGEREHRQALRHDVVGGSCRGGRRGREPPRLPPVEVDDLLRERELQPGGGRRQGTHARETRDDELVNEGVAPHGVQRAPHEGQEPHEVLLGTALDRPSPGCDRVRQGAFGGPPGLSLGDPALEALKALHDAGEVRCVPVAGRRLGGRVVRQATGREAPDQRVERVPVAVSPHQRPALEAGEVREGRPADGLEVRDREALPEDRERRQHRALAVVEEAPSVLADPQQAAVPLGNAGGDRGDLLGALLEALGQLPQRQDPDEPGRQLQAQRQAADPGADPPDGLDVGLGGEAGQGPPGSLREVAHRSAA